MHNISAHVRVRARMCVCVHIVSGLIDMRAMCSVVPFNRYASNVLCGTIDACQLFTGPAFKKQKDIIPDLTMQSNNTMSVDLLAPTALRCHVSVMLLCLFVFRRFLLLTKAKTVS